MNISKELKEKLVAACAASGLQNSNQYAMINDEQLKLDEQRIVNQVADFARRVDDAIKSRLREIYKMTKIHPNPKGLGFLFVIL